MSLDVYLKTPSVENKPRWAIFVRENGATKEISLDDWNQRYPGTLPVLAKVEASNEVYHANITHNLNEMADAAGIYMCLWRPDEIGIEKASELEPLLYDGLHRLRSDPDKYTAHNPGNGWGTYEGLVSFVECYWLACKNNPDAIVVVSR